MISDTTAQKLILIDPESGTYLGEEVILTKPTDEYAFAPPAVISFSALVRSERTR